MAEQGGEASNENGPQQGKPIGDMPGPHATLFEKLFFHGAKDPDFIHYTSIAPYLEYAKQYGDLVHYRISSKGDFVLVNDAEACKTIYESPVFNSRPDDPYIGSTYAIAAGYNDGRLVHALSNDNSEYWARKRKFINDFIIPTYPSRIPALNEAADKLVQYYKTQARGQTKFDIEVYEINRRWIFDLTCDALFGNDCANKNATLKEHFYKATCFWVDSFSKFAPFKYPYTNLISWFFSIGLDKHMRHCHDYLSEILQHKRQTAFGEDWMSILAQKTVDGYSLSDDDIKVICCDLMFGVTGPVPFLIDYGLYSLGKFGYVQEKVLLEHKNVVGEDRLTLNLEDLHKLPYLNGTAMEMLRIYPAGGGIGIRTANADTNFQGYEVPAGTTMVTNVFSIHRQERYWKEPNTVNPLRWAPDVPKHDYAFLTFGQGPKGCPGRNYITGYLAPIVFSRLINSFDIETHKKEEPEVRFALTSTTTKPLVHTLTMRKKF